MTRPRRRRRRLTGALVGAAALLLALEMVASLLVDTPGEFTVPHPVLDHAWPAGGSWVHHEWIADNPAWPEPYLHRYNAQGWIGTDDVDQPKPPGTWRIFYLGDSFIEGTVPMDQSVPSRVEQHLAALPDTGWQFEVINTGTSSYSPVLYELLLRTEVARFEPDAVVISVDMTDLFDDWKYRQSLVTDADGTSLAVTPVSPWSRTWMDTPHGAIEAGLFTRVNLFLYARSHLYQALGVARVALPLVMDGATVFRSRSAWLEEPWSDETERDVAATLATLDAIVTHCRERDIRLMLTAVPRHGQFPHGGRPPELSPRPHEEIAAFCASRGVPFLDSLTALAPDVTDSAYDEHYYHQDMHFNPRGYALWSRAHIEALQDPAHRMLPDGPPADR